MADRAMTPGEMEQYLNGKSLANLATLKRDGSPQVAPVRYEYRDGKFFVSTAGSTAKARNVRRDPRVSVSIASPDEPYAYVLVHGRAKVTTDDMEATVTSISVRYNGDEEGRAFAREVLKSSDNVLIEISPDRVITWTTSD